jgi:hypothetical protein
MDDFDAELATYLAPRVKRLGYLGEFFKCMGHQPQALLAFMQFTEAAKGGLSERLVETIALTVAGWMGNAYERNQHERLSLRLGFGREWVAQVNALDPPAAVHLSGEEQRLQRFILAVLNHKGKGARREFEQLVAELGPEQSTASLLVIGRYVVHALIVNTLDLAPPVPSVFEDGFMP